MPIYVYRKGALIGTFDSEPEAKAVAKTGDVVSDAVLIYDLQGGATTSPAHELFPHTHLTFTGK